MKLYLILIFCVITLTGAAQSNESADEFKMLDPPAEFPGGFAAFYKYISKNLKYPRGEKIEGRVYVEFVINSDGEIDDSSIRTLAENEVPYGSADDIIGDEKFKEEAIRVIKKCPRWKPGLYNGVPAKQRMIVPIVFAF
ncbi:MAG: energy transducer TonB [Cyclobacteriaceae bacterium]